MSKGGQRYETDEVTTYRPKTASKSVIINRVSGNNPRMSLGGGRASMSMSSRSGVDPALYSKLGATGIDGIRTERQKEKRDMQENNERLATYIEKVILCLISILC